MCRYGFSAYKSTYACFQCRKGFKRRLDKDLLPKYIRQDNAVKCPDCGSRMVNLGKDLRLPKKYKEEQWLAIEYLANQNFNFFSCGCSGIGPIPQSLQEAYSLVEQKKQKSVGEQLLEKLALKNK